MLIKRIIEDSIEKSIFKGKIIVIYGARRVGKTTLAKVIQDKLKNEYKISTLYLNCDEPDIKESLTNKTSTELKYFIGNNKLIVIDEAQRVKEIGITLKLLADNFPDIQVIATGSSSFELSNNIVEPLTGRKIEFFLFPLSIEELRSVYKDLEINRLLKNMLIYGMYPEIALTPENKESYIKEIARSYSYKDILVYQNIKNHDALVKLLQALALQIGSEVSYNELSSLVGIDKKTIENYIQILENAFIIFRLLPYSSNKRNELKKLRKIYFYDNGIRNALINNLNPINLRNDTGALWENFLISERIKLLKNNGIDKQPYFWRTLDKQEIDYIEEAAEEIGAFEIKWKEKKLKIPKSFKELYPNAKSSLINNNNYMDFVGKAV